jgi:hypothetical protein
VSKPNKKVPPPFAATTADPGARSATDSSWVKKDMDFKESMAVRDLSSGSESGFNNG